MERISIFNYEAFYLDFLEGNLSEEDALLLHQFLEEHPDLKVDDNPFLVLENDLPKLDDKFKSELKQISFEDDKITPQNIEKFLIAEMEGLLSSNKIIELNQFVADNKAIKDLRKRYASTRLVADRSIIFKNKASLKQGKKIILWPYLSLAAACIVVLFLIWNATTTIVETSMDPIITQIDHNEKKDSLSQNTNTTNNSKDRSIKKNIPETQKTDRTPVQLAVVDTQIKNNSLVQGKIILDHKKAKTITRNYKEIDIIENSSNMVISNQKEIEYTTLGFNEMKNPIQPLTNRLGEVVKKEVDFRSAKATKNQSGGFYLKIGKLEISRRKF